MDGYELLWMVMDGLEGYELLWMVINDYKWL